MDILAYHIEVSPVNGNGSDLQGCCKVEVEELSDKEHLSSYGCGAES